MQQSGRDNNLPQTFPKHGESIKEVVYYLSMAGIFTQVVFRYAQHVGSGL